MLELDHITQHYDGRPLAQDVSLRVAPGQTVALLGASGSGKSTLLKIVAGLQTPEAGRVLWAGQDLAAVPPERRGFALMFQDFALFPHLDVRDNVAFGLIEQRVPKAQARQHFSTPLLFSIVNVGDGGATAERVGMDKARMSVSDARKQCANTMRFAATVLARPLSCRLCPSHQGL